ncbi:MAG: hypothetical protein Unbinned1953contig1002_44 [Prokaryotic dsDNA virus sp.]|mgnify:FL=1|nr:MAG: hypothetical protein Unbinned1953contig1002_44 [Prokaryotic dsDNA virus sp.]|tara:strand:+ start:1107 stop:1490 length:384 start_codon:yes stop_codon:yes gene_type:complete
MEKFYKELKLAKEKLIKANLKKYNVKLSMIDDLDEVLGRLSYLVEATDEAIDEFQQKRMLAADILRFDFRDSLAEAEGYIDDLTDGIAKLGIDKPDELVALESRLDDIYDEEKRLEDAMAQAGFKIN